jgi:cathepsin L
MTELDSALTGRPVSVAVDGTNMVNYRSGIFSNCGTQLTLAALLVGGTDSYYRLKLSWGTGWGEAGYIRLVRATNICGILGAASYPYP